jgi:hypothetical protein
MTASLVLFALLSRPSGTEGIVFGDRDLESAAARAFENGKAERHDGVRARVHFGEAARMYDELWRRGHHDANLTLNRAHAHRLSGSLPRAIVALNEGLLAARWERSLQVALERARDAVAYPVHSDLIALCRPTPNRTISNRMSPTEAQLIAAGLWFLTCGGIARFVMTRATRWLALAGAMIVGLALLGSLWWHDLRGRQREEQQPLLVLREDVPFRKGNADSYPLRLEGASRLPRGVEARELTRRGGWVQIRLPSGVIGWLPEAAVLKVGDR